MRLHVVGLPHTNLTPKYSWCAYTQKVVKFAKMMSAADTEVITYGNGPAEIAGKYVQVDDTQYEDYFVPPFDPEDKEHGWVFKHFNEAVPGAIFDHLAGDGEDIICIIGGVAQASIGRVFQDFFPVVEFGIGYTGTFAKYQVFESYAWMHHVYGIQRPNQWQDGAAHHTVIPNYFDPGDFYVGENYGYLAYLGRICRAKGVDIAIAVAKETGKELKIAGRTDDDDMAWVEDSEYYVGNLEPDERKEFLAHAAAVLCPTRFVDPFCGTHIEALLSGAPVIAPDWGVFTETITDGLNGWRCRSLEDYAEAARTKVGRSRVIIRHGALKYSLDAIAPKYLDYFDRILNP